MKPNLNPHHSTLTLTRPPGTFTTPNISKPEGGFTTLPNFIEPQDRFTPSCPDDNFFIPKPKCKCPHLPPKPNYPWRGPGR